MQIKWREAPVILKLSQNISLCEIATKAGLGRGYGFFPSKEFIILSDTDLAFKELLHKFN